MRDPPDFACQGCVGSSGQLQGHASKAKKQDLGDAPDTCKLMSQIVLKDLRLVKVVGPQKWLQAMKLLLTSKSSSLITHRWGYSTNMLEARDSFRCKNQRNLSSCFVKWLLHQLPVTSRSSKAAGPRALRPAEPAAAPETSRWHSPSAPTAAVAPTEEGGGE